MRQFLAIATALIVAAGSLLTAGPALAQSKGEIVIGVQCDRTGATQIVGTVLCPGFHDYISLVNSKGGVEGHKIKALEIDHEYKVPQGVEAYERHKKDGAVTMAIYGTPHIYALAAKLTEDRIPGTSPGFGSAAAADGIRYPYIFPIAAAEGYYAMQFAGVGTNYPVLNEIREMYKKQGKEPPKEMASTVFYNRGVLIAALHVEAIRNALKAKPNGKITGEDAKKGFEKISNFTLGGLVPPLKITPNDHEGGGLVQIWQVKGGKFEKVTDWYAAYQDVVGKHIKEAGAKK